MIAIRKLKFQELENINQLLLADQHLRFLSQDSLKALIDQAVLLSEKLEYVVQQDQLDFDANNYLLDLLCDTFVLFLDYQHPSMVAYNNLVKIRKIIKRQIANLSLNTLLHYFSAISQHADKLFVEPESVKKIEEFLVENYDVLEFEQKILIMENFNKLLVKDNHFIQLFLAQIMHPKVQITLPQLARVVKAIKRF